MVARQCQIANVYLGTQEFSNSYQATICKAGLIIADDAYVRHGIEDR